MRLTQTCIPSSRSSLSDGYSTGWKYTSWVAIIFRPTILDTLFWRAIAPLSADGEWHLWAYNSSSVCKVRFLFTRIVPSSPRVTRFESREGASRDGNGVEGGQGRDGDGGGVDATNELIKTGMGTEAGIETRAAAEDGNKDVSKNRNWCGDGNADGNGNENGEGREERGISGIRHTWK